MTDPIPRRTFLAAAAVAGLTTEMIPAREVRAGGKGDQRDGRRRRDGLGGRGTSTRRGSRRLPNVEVAYVCDVDDGRVGKARRGRRGRPASRPRRP